MGDNKEILKKSIYSNFEIQAISSKSTIGIGLFSTRNILVYCNATLLSFFDSSSFNEFKTIPLKKVFTDRGLIMQLKRELVENNYFHEKEIAFITLTGKSISLIANGCFVYYNNSKHIMVSFSDKNIQKTQQSRLAYQIQKLSKKLSAKKKKLKLKEKQFQAVFNLSPDAIVQLDGYKIVDCNSTALSLWGLSDRDEILGLYLFDLLPENQSDGSSSFNKVEELFLQYSVNQKSEAFLLDQQHSNGSIIKTEVRITTFSETDEPKYFLWIMPVGNKSTKTHGEKTNEETIRLKEQISLMFNYSADMLCIIDSDGYFRHLNPAWKKVLGWSQNELLNTLWLELFHPDDFEKTKKAGNNLSENQPTVLFDTRLKCKNGDFKWVAWNTSILSDRNLLFAVVRDISKRKKDEQKLILSQHELQQLNVQKDRFFTILSHDLRSPVSNLFQLSDILYHQFENINDDEKKNLIHTIKESAKNTLSLTNDVLVWAKGQMGNLEINPENLLLQSVIDETILSLQPNAIKKQIIIENHTPDYVTCFVDLNCLKVILRNLISNAIKFTNIGGNILIAAINQEQDCIFSVSDNGLGMNSDQLGSLFDITQTFSTYGTDEEKGSGIGLILCKDLVEINNGKIWANSQENSGSTFYFSFPLKS